jgi:hypothetical protein
MISNQKCGGRHNTYQLSSSLTIQRSLASGVLNFMRSFAGEYREVVGRNAGRNEELFAFSWCLAVMGPHLLKRLVTPAIADDKSFY